jgi:PAS domain S-box-containing protein
VLAILCAQLLLSVPWTNAEQLPLKTYTTAQGLARDYVSRIRQDSRGFLWFCTSDGLSRFDGYGFTNYSTAEGLPHRVVNDILESRNGEYWIATAQGLALLNPKAGKPEEHFTVLRPTRTKRAEYVLTIFEDRGGVIWLGTGGGLYRLDQSGGRRELRFVELGMPVEGAEGAGVNAILEDEKGALWLGTESGIYRRLPSGQVEHYATGNGLPHDEVATLLKDRTGNLWAGTSQGLCLLVAEPSPDRTIVARLFTTGDGLANNKVSSSAETSDGHLWVGTVGGLVELIPQSKPGEFQIRNYTKAEGLSDNIITSLMQDREGDLWVGSDSGGLMKVARGGFTTYTETDGLGSGRIAAFIEDRAGAFYALTTSFQTQLPTINRFDGRRFSATTPRLPKEVKNTWGWYQLTLQDHAGEWWVPTAHGLFRFPRVSSVEQLAVTSPRAVYTSKEGMPNDEIFRLFEDSRGDIWISTVGPNLDPLVRWERSTDSFHHYTLTEGMPRVAPTAFQEDQSGSLWMGFYDGGLVRYRDGRFTNFTVERDHVPAGVVRGLYVDQSGRLWVATSQGGLGRVEDLGSDHPRITSYTTAEGLASDHVTAVTEDRWGRIYVGTGRGLDRLDPQTGRIKHYTAADGLANNYINVALRDRAGSLWFGTLQGISKLVPELEAPAPAPPVLISALRIAGLNYPISELGETEVGRIELETDKNQIQAEFLSLLFAPGQTLRYQYMLEGADRDWSTPAAERTITYANLQPGSYVFKVRALNSDGVMSQRPAQFAFTILPPIWRRWWFITIAALLIIGVIIAVERYRAARVRELNAALSESKQLTEQLTTQRGELYQANRTLELEFEVTRILAEAETGGEAAPRILQVICENTGWDVGAIWRVTNDNEGLGCVAVWHQPTVNAASFEALTKDYVFSRGEGLPGRVWAEGKPLWISALEVDENFPRLSMAVREGLQSAFGFPVLLEGESLGVLEFFSREHRERDEDLTVMLSTIGIQIGQLIERKQAEETLRESENRFRTLAETASDAIITIDARSRIIFVNAAAEKIFGYAMDELVGADMSMLMPEYLRHLHQAGLGRYVETGRKHISWEGVELPGLHKDGREIPLELSFGEFEREGQRFFTGIARDVSERKRAEEALRQAREERLRELERVRKRIATDLHDDIGSSLTQISILSEVVRQQIGQEDSPVTTPLYMIANASRELVDSMSDIVWAINPQKDHLSDLTQRMRRFASDVFTARNIEFRFRGPATEDDVQLGANVRRELFLIFKESINNMVRHSGCTSADIEFRVEGDHILLKLGDNGKGFDTSGDSDGHGLASMKERARGLSGALEIVSSEGRGTTTTLYVPLAQNGRA